MEAKDSLFTFELSETKNHCLFYKGSVIGVEVGEYGGKACSMRAEVLTSYLEKLVKLNAHGIIEAIAEKDSEREYDNYQYPLLEETLAFSIFTVLGAKIDVIRRFNTILLIPADEESQAIIDKHKELYEWVDEVFSAYKGEADGFKEYLETFIEMVGDGDGYPDELTLAMREYNKQFELSEELESDVYFWSQIL